MYSERSDASDSSSTPYVVASGGVCRLRLALPTRLFVMQAERGRLTIQLMDSLHQPRFMELSFNKEKWTRYVEDYTQNEESDLDVRKRTQALLVAVRSVRAICVSVGREHQVQCVDIDAHTHARCRRRTATTVRRRTTRR